MSGQVSRGSAGEYKADEQVLSRGSAGEYQADEQAGVVLPVEWIKGSVAFPRGFPIYGVAQSRTRLK